jgi:Protein of unknown function (DUF3071)
LSRFAMHDLQLVGLTTDRRGLIFRPRAGARTDAGFVVPVTDDLVALVAELADELAAAEQVEPVEPDSSATRPEVGAAAAKPRSQMSVRDIQARLRAGEPVAQVAREAGVDEDWIERFAPPVRAEQRRIVDRALEHHLQRARSAPSAVPLRRAVGMALADKGIAYTVAAFDAAWSAHLLGHDRWAVSFTYRHRGHDRTATWTYDAADDELTAGDRTASQLGYVAPGAAGDEDGQAIDGIIGDPEATNQIGTASPGRTRRSRSGSTSRSSGTSAAEPGSAPPASKRSRPKATSTGRAATEKKAARKQATTTKKASAAKKAAATKKMATAKKATAAKKASAAKKSAKRSSAKKAATKKSTAKKSSGKKATTKKSGAKKSAAKKSGTKKSAAKKTATKTPAAKKAAAAKPPADEAPAAGIEADVVAAEDAPTGPVTAAVPEVVPSEPVEVEQTGPDEPATAAPRLRDGAPRPPRDTRRPDEHAAPARPVAGRPGQVPMAEVPLARRPPTGNGHSGAVERPAPAPDDPGVDADRPRAEPDPAAARRARAAERNAPTVQFRSGSAAPVRAAAAVPEGRIDRSPEAEPEPAADRSRTEPGASNGAARPETRRRRQLRAR